MTVWALSIGAAFCGASLLAIICFCIGYHVGSNDTRQEILERDPWE